MDSKKEAPSPTKGKKDGKSKAKKKKENYDIQREKYEI